MKASIARVTQFSSQPVDGTDVLLDAATKLNIKNFSISKERGKTIINGVARYQTDSDLFFDVVQQIDGWESDFILNLQIEHSDIRGYHTVQEGETLASIARRHLGSASREMAIFEANRDRMNDPDQIFPGQQLLIPWR